MDNKVAVCVLAGVLAVAIIAWGFQETTHRLGQLSFVPTLPPAHNEAVTKTGIHSTGQSAP